MKVVLAYPNFPAEAGLSPHPPLGILYLGTIAKRIKGIEVELIDTTFDKDYSAIRRKIQLSKPDVLGVSILTKFAAAGFEMAKIAKEIYPDVFVIMGGAHATILPLETIENEHVDAVCLGEGEATFVELLDNLNNLENVKGIYYKKDGEIKMNPPRPPIEDLDTIPFPERSLLPTFKNYISSSSRKGRGATTIIASRGCPFNCSFCQPTLREIFGKKVRFRSAKNVVDEMEYLMQSYNIAECRFEDDTFTAKYNWVRSICEEILRRGITMSWIPNARADTVTREMLMWMKKAGCREIDFGVESGSEFIRNSVLGKGISTKTIKEAFQLCHDVGIQTKAFIMLGSPGENKQTLQQTLNLVGEIKPQNLSVSRANPVPGTILWDKAEESGLLTSEVIGDYHDFEHLPIKLVDITKEDIRKTEDALLMQIYVMNLRKYLPSAFRHPLSVLRKLTKLNTWKTFIFMGKSRNLTKVKKRQS